MEDQQRKSLTIEVSIKDTDVFEQFLGVASKIVMDERMPDGLRDDAMVWLNDIGASAGTVVSAGQPNVQEQIVVLCETVPLGKIYWNEINHKYNTNAKVRFIGESSRNVDGLRPDKVVLVGNYHKSAAYRMLWVNSKGEYPEVIHHDVDETGDFV